MVGERYTHLQQRVEAPRLFPLLQLLCARLDLMGVRRRSRAQDMVENALGQRIRLSGHLEKGHRDHHAGRVEVKSAPWWGIVDNRSL
jgi:hypothetical protein